MSLCIRVATAEDASGIAAIYGPIVRDTAISFEEDVPDVAETARRILRTLAEHPWLVADAGGIVGYAYAGPFATRAAYRYATETSVYVADGERGRGTGARLYAELLRLLRKQGFRTACAGIVLPNDGSLALHRRFGFSEVGIYRAIGFKHGAWRDVARMQCDLAGATALPPDLVPFASLDDRAGPDVG